MPRVLEIPRVLAPVDHRLAVIEPRRGERHRRVHRRDRLDRVWLVAAELCVRAHGAQLRVCLEHRDDRGAALRVALHDRQAVQRVGRCGVGRRVLVGLHEPQFHARGRFGQLEAVVAAAVDRRAQFHNRLRIGFAGDVGVRGAHAAPGHADEPHRCVIAHVEDERDDAIAPYNPAVFTCADPVCPGAQNLECLVVLHHSPVPSTTSCTGCRHAARAAMRAAGHGSTPYPVLRSVQFHYARPPTCAGAVPR